MNAGDSAGCYQNFPGNWAMIPLLRVSAIVRIPFRSAVATVATDVICDDASGVRSYLLHCERSSGRYLFDALVSVGHDFGMEIDGFRVPGI
jgi:hypothetical protein